MENKDNNQQSGQNPTDQNVDPLKNMEQGGGQNNSGMQNPVNNTPNQQTQPSQSQNTVNTPQNTEAKTEEKKDVSFENYAPDFDSKSKKEEKVEEQEGNKTGTVITAILIAIIAFGIWQTNKNDTSDTNTDNNNSGIMVDDTQQDGDVKIVEEDKKDDSTTMEEGDLLKITAYYAKSSSTTDCSSVFPLEREIPKKYESSVVNTVRGLLTGLSSSELADGWITNIPAGTYLRNVSIKDGKATVKLSEGLNRAAGSCAVSSARAQIEKTLLQFSYINSVDICVNDNCNQDEILQP